MNSRSPATLSLLLAAAAAASPLTFSNRSPSTARVGVGDRELVLSATGERLSGPEVELHWQKDRLEGAYRNHDVRLRVDGDRVKGNIGATTVSVKVTRTDEGLQLRGSEGEEPVDLYVGPNRMTGELGGCRFTMKTTDDRYHGTRACEPSAYPAVVTMTLPGAFAGQNPERLAALVAVLLTPMDVVAGLEPMTPSSNVAWHGFGVKVADTAAGVRITQVIPDSPAALAGVEAGMVVTRAGTMRVRSAKELTGALMRMRPSGTILLQLHWPDRAEQLEIHLTAPPLAPLSNGS
jgi:hypothetical protein